MSKPEISNVHGSLSQSHKDQKCQIRKSHASTQGYIWLGREYVGRFFLNTFFYQWNKEYFYLSRAEQFSAIEMGWLVGVFVSIRISHSWSSSFEIQKSSNIKIFFCFHMYPIIYDPGNTYFDVDWKMANELKREKDRIFYSRS